MPTMCTKATRYAGRSFLAFPARGRPTWFPLAPSAPPDRGPYPNGTRAPRELVRVARELIRVVTAREFRSQSKKCEFEKPSGWRDVLNAASTVGSLNHL
jgi:hypothetical protein